MIFIIPLALLVAVVVMPLVQPDMVEAVAGQAGILPEVSADHLSKAVLVVAVAGVGILMGH